MKKYIEELNDIKEKKTTILDREAELLDKIVSLNNNLIHSYLEMPILNTDLAEIFFSTGIDYNEKDVNKVFVLCFELPEIHLNLISSFWITENEDNYTISTNSPQDSWCGMWTGETNEAQVVELNEKNEGETLTTFYCSSASTLIKLDSGKNDNTSFYDFVINSKNMAIEKIEEFFKNNDFLNGTTTSINGKKIIVSDTVISNITDKLNDITNSMCFDFNNKDFVQLEQSSEAHEIKDLSLTLDRYEATYQKNKLEKELSNEKNLNKAPKI